MLGLKWNGTEHDIYTMLGYTYSIIHSFLVINFQLNKKLSFTTHRLQDSVTRGSKQSDLGLLPDSRRNKSLSSKARVETDMILDMTR